jgi:hypothetical protein
LDVEPGPARSKSAHDEQVRHAQFASILADRRATAHTRAAATHRRAAEPHEESANLHEEHAGEMRGKGLVTSAERAERIADHERMMAEQERSRQDHHRRSANVETDSAS